MAKLWFSRADVANLFGLKDSVAVERLERSGVLEVTAYTTSGRPLYSADAVLRAARRVHPGFMPEPPSSEQAPR